MNKLSKLAFGTMAFIVASCSSEEPVINGPDNGNADGDIYATLNLKLPTGGTRAANEGEEFGKDRENYVGKVMVVLTTKDATDVSGNKYIYLTHKEADTFPGGVENPGHSGNYGEYGNAKNEFKYTLTFNANELKGNSDLGVAQDKEEVYVFAFCNPTARVRGIIESKNPGDVLTNGMFGEVSPENSVWEDNKFLMTNSEIPAPVEIPAKADLVSLHNTPEKALNLGTVHVKRVAARFDFALGGTNKDNKYDIDDVTSGTPNTKMGTVELTQMAMFNIANRFYYLPRTNSLWTWKGTTTLCGELENGYVMSFNEGGFKSSSVNYDNYKNYYFANLIGNKFDKSATADDRNGGSTTLVWTSIKPADWNKEADTDDPNWTPQVPAAVDYRIWRYATENTIPALESGNATASQRVGITTGVVFKGEFTPAESKKTTWNGNAVYVHNGLVYGDFAALKAYVTKYPESIVAHDFKEVSQLQNAAETADPKVSLIKDLTKAQSHGFKAYEAEGNATDGYKYIMYYFYYNRHNTNDKNYEMGDNEFGVVRNNVYKLQVTKCGSLGEPKAPEDPDDPNEEENAYFTLSCHVMPWTVRINNIEF